MERKQIGKKLRFEVLKRDNFCCQYCSSRPPKVPQERTERIKLAQDQYKQYKKLLKAKNKEIESDINAVESVYSACFEGWVFGDRFRISVKKFIEKLGVEETIDAMEKACSKIYDESKALKYFCGICWTKIKGEE